MRGRPTDTGRETAGRDAVGLGWGMIGAAMLGVALSTPLVLSNVLSGAGAVDPTQMSKQAVATGLDAAAVADTRIVLAEPQVRPLPAATVPVTMGDRDVPRVSDVRGVDALPAAPVPSRLLMAGPTDTTPAGNWVELRSWPVPRRVTSASPLRMLPTTVAPEVADGTAPGRPASRTTPPQVEPQGLAPPSRLALAATLQGYAEQGELVLELAPAARRRLQLGLKLLGHDPGVIDGIFGDQTRAAIRHWQVSTGLRPTGFVDEGQRDRLVADSAQGHDEWLLQQRRARAAAQPRTAISAIPVARQSPQCARNAAGEIIENQSFRCDVAVLRESLSTLFGGRS